MFLNGFPVPSLIFGWQTTCPIRKECFWF